MIISTAKTSDQAKVQIINYFSEIPDANIKELMELIDEIRDKEIDLGRPFEHKGKKIEFLYGEKKNDTTTTAIRHRG